jgi:hypothetical protein
MKREVLGYFVGPSKSPTFTTAGLCKRSLKIPNGQSETVYRRRTDNTMVKRKGIKGQTTINKTYI